MFFKRPWITYVCCKMPNFDGWFSIYLMLNCVISHQKDCFCALKGLQVNLAPLHCHICKNMYVWIYDWCKSVALKPRFDDRPKILMKMQGWYNDPKWEILTFIWPHSYQKREKNGISLFLALNLAFLTFIRPFSIICALWSIRSPYAASDIDNPPMI